MTEAVSKDEKISSSSICGTASHNRYNSPTRHARKESRGHSPRDNIIDIVSSHAFRKNFAAVGGVTRHAIAYEIRPRELGLLQITKNSQIALFDFVVKLVVHTLGLHFTSNLNRIALL